MLAWSDRLVPVREFYRRRFARVVPAYVVAACIGIALDVWQYGSETFARGLFTLTLLQSWIPGERFSYAGNSVGWSLSTEVFFYALFPLLIKLVSELSRAD